MPLFKLGNLLSELEIDYMNKQNKKTLKSVLKEINGKYGMVKVKPRNKAEMGKLMDYLGAEGFNYYK